MIFRRFLAGFVALAALAIAGPAASQDEKTLADFEAECDTGVVESCHEVGRAYMTGVDHPSGVEKDDERAWALFTKGCDGDLGRSCNNLGVLSFEAEEGSARRALAIGYFTKGCELNDAGACENLGIRYLKGVDVEKDVPRGGGFIAKACDLGSPRACYNAGILNRNGEITEVDLPTAYAQMTKACDADYGPACRELGLFYGEGTGVEVDIARAVELYEHACDLGDGGGCYNLGLMYNDGEGVTKSQPIAFTFFAKACENGFGHACDVIVGTKGNCVDIYRDFALEGEFNAESRKVLRFYANVAGDGKELFESHKLGINVRLNSYVSGPTDFDPDDRVDDVDEGVAEIVMWPNQPPYYMEASEELTTDEEALAFVDHMCGLIEHGVVVDKIKGSIFTTIFTSTTDN